MKSPNHALQRTAPCVTAPASAAAFPPTMQVPRRTPRLLSLGSFGDFAPFMQLIAALLFGFAAHAIAESNDYQEALKIAKTEVRVRLDQFAKDNSDHEPLLAAQKLSASLNPRGDKTHLSQLDEGCLRLQLEVLLVLAAARDQRYDRYAPENTVYLNVAPPLTKHSEPLMAGVDPKAIKDPDARKAYEAAIAQNHKRNEKLKREMAISRGVDYALLNIWVFVNRGFPDGSLAKVEASGIVEKTITNRVLLDRFKSETMPGLTW